MDEQSQLLKKIPLLDGNDIPAIGLSSFCCNTNEETIQVVENALDQGIRHFEIAELFGNAHLILNTIRSYGIDRSEIFISLKIWPKDRGPRDVVLACLEILSSAGLEYVDLLILHGPLDIINGFDQWRAFEYIQNEEKLTKSIGLANYNEKQVTEILKNSTSGGPAILEMEATPYRCSTELIGFCGDGGIVILNNNPMGKAHRIDDPALIELGEFYGLSSTHLLLKWAYLQGHALLLSTSNILDDNLNFEQILSSDQLPESVIKQLEVFDTDLKTTYITREIQQDD